jgi:hypothetical protein
MPQNDLASIAELTTDPDDWLAASIAELGPRDPLAPALNQKRLG